MSERLPAHLEAAGLIRQAEAEGGFGTIIKRGDADRGALILLITEQGRASGVPRTRAWPAMAFMVGSRSGQRLAPIAKALADWSQKRVRFDEDLWLIELDIPDPERFIAETASKG